MLHTGDLQDCPLLAFVKVSLKEAIVGRPVGICIGGIGGDKTLKGIELASRSSMK